MVASTEKIVKSIQSCGEQLIKDAPIIAGDFFAHQKLDIYISIDLEQGAVPTISFTSDYIPETYIREHWGDAVGIENGEPSKRRLT